MGGRGRKKKQEGKERKGEWNWEVVQKSSFRILEVASLAGRLAFANCMTGSKEFCVRGYKYLPYRQGCCEDQLK